MKVAVCVFLLALLALGESLKCYSCPDGSSGDCTKVQQCQGHEDSCMRLQLQSSAKTYWKCVNFASCDYDALRQDYPGERFLSFCCGDDLCNSAYSTPARPLIGLLAGLVTLFWAML